MRNMCEEKFDIIIIAGQSNAEGYGVGPVDCEYVPSDKILWLKDDADAHFEQVNGKDVLSLKENPTKTISVAEEPEGEFGKIGKLSFIFAKNYMNQYLKSDRKILIVNCAVGGTGFARPEWGVGNVLHNRMIDLVSYALSLNNENKVVAFLWHQGECDSFENAEWDVYKKYSVHKNNLINMMNDVYSNIKAKVPFIAGGFCDEWYYTEKTPCDAVLKAIKEVCLLFNGAFVETKGLISNNQKIANGDTIHFCRQSLYKLGNMYFEEYNKLLNKC